MGTLTAVLLLELMVRLVVGLKLQRLYHNDIDIPEVASLRPHPVLGYEKIPSINGVNSYGMLSREHPIDKKHNTYRILSLGDSVTQWRKYSEYLEDYLNSKIGKKIEVWHNATCGYGILQYKQFIMLYIKKYSGFSLN